MKLWDGTLLHSAEEVHDATVTFFQELLSAAPIEAHEESFQLLSPIVIESENSLLCVVPSLEEVKDALWSIP